ncbi:unnamed protein product [Ceratitis capitata]|uniref:(Mediterranean fruit fly) hypothetical protein n=1 Tax=Ceratitis capitata TaxID=7213 RepID=A0A811V5E4_CERCA|nr:unnamed protein product [Ceratitis capitata]
MNAAAGLKTALLCCGIFFITSNIRNVSAGNLIHEMENQSRMRLLFDLTTSKDIFARPAFCSMLPDNEMRMREIMFNAHQCVKHVN